MQKLAKFYPTLLLGYSFLPLVAGAQTTNFESLIGKIGNTLQSIIGLLFVIATVVFLWGVITFIASAGDQAKRDKSKAIMTWGILGLAVMVAAWGIVQILVGYFGVGNEGIPAGPRQN